MKVQLQLNMRAQPTGETCGPTCLHAVYRYHGDEVSLEQVVREVPSLETGGTLGVMLAVHALRRGYSARIYSYNLHLLDPTWFEGTGVDVAARLREQRRHKRDARLQTATAAYLEFLELGGELCFEDLTRALIRKYLDASHPILTGLSATFLYRSMREYGPQQDDDDIRGEPLGHFVVLAGYDRQAKTVEVVDPLQPNPLRKGHRYYVTMDRLIAAILLGVVTYDGNLVIIRPR